MSKTSKRAILTIIVIATLLTVMIPIIPVMAEVYIDADLVSVVSVASWEEDATYGDVVELDTVDVAGGSEYAIVRIDVDTGLTLATIVANLPDFMYKVTDQSDRNYLALELYFESSAGTGYVELSIFPYVSTVKWNNDINVWQKTTGHSGATLAMAWGETDEPETITEEAFSTDLDTVIANIDTLYTDGAGVDLTDYELTRVGVQLGWVAITNSQIALIDMIEVDGTTYDLELIEAEEGFTIDYVTTGDAVYDDVITVIGSGVTSGSVVNFYWDFVTASALLNATTGKPSGEFECEVDVPSAVYGDHYIWVKDLDSGISVRSDAIFVVPKISLSPSSGLEDDEITIKGYGFNDESEVTFTFDATTLTTVPATVETDDDGYFKCTFDVPTDVYTVGYEVIATDGKGKWDSALFTVGASVSLDPKEGPSGKVVTITGEGWTYTEVITVTIVDPVTSVYTVGKTDMTVGSNGKFSGKIVIPSLDTGEYTIKVEESDVGSDGVKGPATAEFEVTGESVIKLTPGYGPPGGSVEIKGYNFTQISGTEITLTVGTEDIVHTIETDSKGEFSGTIRIPAIDYQIHPLTASDEYDLSDTKDFRVGIMIVIISPNYGPTGTLVSITGIGFSMGMDWNATIDGVALTDEAEPIGGATEAISKEVFIPTIPADTYTITVLDIDTEIEVTATFVVTAVTEVSMDPASAPNLYNVTIKGLNFAEYEGTSIDFVLYNATDEWNMDVYQTIGTTDSDAETDKDGEFTAWWEVLDDETLSIGTYTVNVTDGEDLFAQTSFSIVKARVDVTPRKALFDRGDTIQFNVRNDFDFDDSYMKIWDPDDNLYWQTETFVGWVKTAELYTVPYYMQTSGGNPMELSIDAPLGTWFWAFYTVDDDQLVNGTFVVGPSAEALITEQIQALSEELGIDIDTLRVYMDELGIDMNDLSTDMNEAISGMAGDLAAAVAAAEAATAAVQDVGDIAGDALDAANDAVSAADAAKAAADAGLDAANAAQATSQAAADAAQDAADAADDNRSATSGLTTLVYGAIGASLIAALAAIVSLMQISRRIAG